ncbi:unnamed protein product [Colias eurytheme]|nr:unnamed protein product [Colias eurytheme]
MDLGALVACLVTSSLCRTALAQSSVCDSDDQCEKGFYCETEAFACRKCLSCDQLKRDPPLGSPPCIKSVAQCGSCFKGLVADLRGDVNSACVLPDSRGHDALPAYVWVAVSFGLLVFVVLAVLLVVYVFRNMYTFRILASTRTSVQSPYNGSGPPASAPEPPPPYNAQYTPVRPSSPPADAANDESWSFVKRAPANGRRGERESAGSQAARVFNNPSYVRGPHLANLPPSYDTGAGESEEERGGLHDEDTMESTWTPQPDTHAHTPVSGAETGNTGVSNTSAELSSLLAAARSTALLRTPHCAPASQDSNNNRSSGETTMGNGEMGGPSNTGPSFIINVVQNINTVQQQNDVTL